MFLHFLGGQIQVCTVGKEARYKYYTGYCNFYNKLQMQQGPFLCSQVKESCHGEYRLDKNNKKSEVSIHVKGSPVENFKWGEKQECFPPSNWGWGSLGVMCLWYFSKHDKNGNEHSLLRRAGEQFDF